MVIAEHDNNAVVPLTYNTISAAKQLGGDVTLLIAGKDCTKVRKKVFFGLLHCMSVAVWNELYVSF